MGAVENPADTEKDLEIATDFVFAPAHKVTSQLIRSDTGTPAPNNWVCLVLQ